MELFDTHSHYFDEKFDEDRERIISQVYKEGVTLVVTLGDNIENSKKAITLAEKYEYMYAACGIHPCEIGKSKEEIDRQIKQIEELTKHKKVVAIGEIGLDYYWEKETKELQKYALLEQIKLANKLELPICVHSRDAVMDTIEILRGDIEINKKGILHCCPLNKDLVKAGIEAGFYISFAGPVTFKSSKNADEIIKMVPDDKILIETDSPYLSPEPNRGKRNDSRNVKYVAEKIANVKEMKLENIAKITYDNAKRIYNI